MNNLLQAQALSTSTFEVITSLFLATALGIITAIIYKQTHKGTSYSQSFVTSLVLLTIIAAMIIMVIGNSIVTAIGLVGVFTIIRFRTAVKDTKDLTFMFLALSLGLASGVRAYSTGILALAIIAVLLLIFDRIRFGSVANYEYVLSFSLKHIAKDKEPYLKLFSQFLKDHILLNTRSYKSGNELELSFNIILKNPKQLSNFASSLSQIKNISKVELISLRNDIEY